MFFFMEFNKNAISGEQIQGIYKNKLIAGAIMELIKIIISIILPPLGVFMQVGIGKHFWLNILLTLCGYLPGIVHAIWVIAKNK